MRLIKVVSAVFAMCTAAAACGHIAIQNEYGENTGLEVYPPRPYIMVARTKAKERPIEVSVVYLADTTRPHYVHLQPGLIGSSKLNVSVTNGMVTSLGAESTSGTTELLTAYGGLATALANAAKTRDDIQGQRELRAQSAPVQTYANTVRDVVADLNPILANPPLNVLNTTELNVLRALVPRLSAVETDLRRGNAVENFPAIRTTLQRIVKEWEDGLGGLPANVTETDVRFRLDRMRATLKAIVDDNEPEDDSLEFTLFEIVQTRIGNSKDEIGTMTTSLREVRDVTVREEAARVHAQGNQ